MLSCPPCKIHTYRQTHIQTDGDCTKRVITTLRDHTLEEENAKLKIQAIRTPFLLTTPQQTMPTKSNHPMLSSTKPNTHNTASQDFVRDLRKDVSLRTFEKVLEAPRNSQFGVAERHCHASAVSVQTWNRKVPVRQHVDSSLHVSFP